MAGERCRRGPTRPGGARSWRASCIWQTWSAFDWGALGFLFLVTVLFHGPLIMPNPDQRRSYPSGDFYDQFHAFAVYEHDRLWPNRPALAGEPGSTGGIPLWNPANFGGHPFLADVQAAVFYPPSLLVMLLSGPGPFSPLWLEVEAIAHFYMAAVFTYLFMRRLLGGDRIVAGVERAAGMETRPTGDGVAAGMETCPTGDGVAAGMDSRPTGRATGQIAVVVGPLLSALVFAFGGYLTGYPSQQLAILETQAWLPLILLMLDVGLAERKRHFVLGAGLAWGMALLAGHPQSAMYVLYGALSYALYRSWQARLDWRRVMLGQAAWIGVGLGLAAVHLLPAYEFMRLSVRSSLTYEELAGGFILRDMVQYLVPGVFTHWWPMYVGILPLFLAVMACVLGWRRGKRGKVPVWLALALVSLALSFGGKAYLHRLFYWVVPGFRLFRSQERAIYLTSFALAVLAGWGWQWLYLDRGQRASARRGSYWLLTLGVVSVVGAWIVWMARGAMGFEAAIWLRQVSLLAALAWVSWALVRWVSGGTVWGAIATLAVVMLDLGLVNMPRNLAPGRAESRVYDGAWLKPVLEDHSLYRIANEWGLPGNAGCWLRRQDLYGASPLRLSAHQAMSSALPHWRLWQLFDVRYVTTWEHDLPGPFAAERVAMHGQEWAKDTVYAFRLQPDFPRAWVVHRARRVDDSAALSLLADPAFDPFAEILLSGNAPDGYAPGDPPFAPLAEVVDYEPERILVHADVSAPGWLVLGEWDYPGWQAIVDDRRQDIYRVDYGLRAVPLSAGEHVVELRYRPASVYGGAAISIVTLAATVALMLVPDRPRKR